MARVIGADNKRLIHNIIAISTSFLLALLFVFLIWGEAVKAPNHEPYLNSVKALTDWTTVDENGEVVPITLPDSPVLVGRDNVTISTNIVGLPREYNTLAIWSKGQSIKLYVSDELVYVYNANNADHFGADSTYIYLFVPLPENVSDSVLKIEYDAVLDRDAGKIGDIYIGTTAACLARIVQQNQIELSMGLFVLLVGSIELILAVVLHFITKRDVSLYYLACSVIVLSFWVISNCRARQFVFPNASIIRNCAFLVLPLISICFCLYMDAIQKRRYHIFYGIIEVLSLINLIVITVLNYTNIAAFSDTRMVSLILISMTLIVVVATILYDRIKRKDRSYILVSIGLLSLAVCGVIQLVLEQTKALSIISGTAISVGLILLVVFGLLYTVKQIGEIDDDRLEAIEKVETLSRASMEALAKTVDAKDRYTSGHSLRVAQASCAIAKELGWDEDQIFELRFQGMMHDIGKIGVPDTVLNKPGRLSNIEFELIQAHTTVGSEILKNVTSIADVELAARHHHERYDGNGYPDHLAGADIPLNARIIGIADAYDAMNSDRVYRKALPKEVIREELIKGKGSQFDPDLVDVFIKLLDAGKLESSEDIDTIDKYVERKDDDFDSTEFSQEVEKEIKEIIEDYNIEEIERVKLGEIVRFLRRLRDEYYKDFQALVLSVRPLEGTDPSETYMAKAMESIEVAIRKSIRDIDIYARYSKSQMLVVLFDVDSDNMGIIIQRILLDYYKLFDAAALDVSYKVVDLDEEYHTGVTIAGE